MNFRRMANQHVKRRKLDSEKPELSNSGDNNSMFKALARSASLKKSPSTPPAPQAQTTTSLNSNKPSEPAKPCVFTDKDIRPISPTGAVDPMPSKTTAKPDLARKSTDGTTTLRKLVLNGGEELSDAETEVDVDNEGSSKNNKPTDGDVDDHKMASDIDNKARRSSWYSWVWSDSSKEETSMQPTEEQEATTTDDALATAAGTPVGSGSPQPGKEGSPSPSPPPSIKDKSWAFWSRANTSQAEIAVTGTKTEESPKPVATPKEQARPSKSAEPKSPSSKRRHIKPNVVAPTTTTCFPVTSQSYRIRTQISKLGQYFAPPSHKVQEWDHLLRCAPKRISKAVVIGVHGFFPTKMVRTILGEPTGTSIKFANEAALAVQRWADEKGYEIKIEKIALEGEGKVLDRVEKLYKLLQNWIDAIHEADFVYFAAHSQGTPVAVHLLARLVEEGHVENKQLALLGMAGISLGPNPGMDQSLMMRAYSSIESASLFELFQFQRLESLQSRKYLDSIRTIINQNTKLLFVGSMNDQLVPLYSSTSMHISHPNVYRAVYVDGQDVVAPEFLSTLISIALHLRNIGSSDHGVIKEISAALSGPLTGGGHSKIYNESRVYDLMVRHALETTSPPADLQVHVDTEFKVPSATSNPYVLPWCLRGMMHEATSRNEFDDQIEELVSEFERWKPDTKPLKDVKYRLGAITMHAHKPKL